MAATVDGMTDELCNAQAPAPPFLGNTAAHSQESAEKKKSEVGVSIGPGGITLQISDREWRIRGIEKNTSYDLLKVNLRVQWRNKFHLDTVDLYQARQRQNFVTQATEGCGLEADLVHHDLAKVLYEVEGMRDQHLMGIMQPTESLPKMTEEERSAALAWLKAPNLIGRLRDAFRQSGIVGEENNALVAYLAGMSRKLERPLAIVIQSASAAGKTTLMDAVLSFFPEEDRVKYSAITGQSLYYMGETSLKHKILAVSEEAGAEKASYALKLLQSEGELTIASTGKNRQTGKMTTQEYHVMGPVMIFLSTTAIDLDDELQNRCLTLAVDESSEQTQRIHQCQRERRTLAGLLAKTKRQDLLKLMKNVQRLLLAVEVLNPYAPKLTFNTSQTRNRRDHEKYLTLIDSIALLHQYQRQTKLLPPAGTIKYIEVTLDDIALANALAPEILGRSLDELAPQTRQLLKHIRQVLKPRLARGNGQPREEMGEGHFPDSTTTFTRKELRDHCGWSLTQLLVHLKRLVDLEYLRINQGRIGRQFVYEALFDLATDGTIIHVELIDVAKMRSENKCPNPVGESNLAGFIREVTGQNSHLTGGVAPTPIPV